MKILWLPGAKCTKEIWRYMIKDWEEEDNVFVKYSHDVLLQAKQVMDITKDVYDCYGKASYDYIIGHSMGGKIALQLCADFQMRVKGIIFIETNLRPAAAFYRNLLLAKNSEVKDELMSMLQEESIYYLDALNKELQETFDDAYLVQQANCLVYGVYGDRGLPAYPDRIHDLCLDADTLAKLQLFFVKDSCHMPMLENPDHLTKIIKGIIR